MTYRLIFDPVPAAVVGLLICAMAVIGARTISGRTGFAAAGPVALIALAPLMPPLPIKFGIGLDDVLPLTGTALLVLTPGLARGVRRITISYRMPLMLAAAGLALVLIAGGISSVANGKGVEGAATMFLRSSGRFALVSAIALLIAAAISVRKITSYAVAVIVASAGSIVAVGSLIEFLTPLRHWVGASYEGGGIRILDLVIHGRLTGTTGVANFTAATLMVSSIVTVGLGVSSKTRERVAWLTLAAVQLGVIGLTSTRASMVLAAIAIVVLVVLSGRPVLLLPLAGLAAALAAATPLVSRFVGDSTNRFALWASAWHIMVDHPLTGVGAGNMLATMQANPDRYAQTPFGPAISTAHNIVLLAGAELGAFGLVGMGFVCLGMGIAGLRIVVHLLQTHRNQWVVFSGALAAMAFLGQGMTNNLVTFGVTSVFGAVVFGGFLLTAPDAEARPDRREPLGADG